MAWLKQLGWERVALLVLAAAVAALYATGLRHGLVFDDHWIVRDREQLSAPLALDAGFRSLWRISYPLVHQWLGPELHWQRVLNLVLHLVNTLLLWALTRRLVCRAWHEDAGRWTLGPADRHPQPQAATDEALCRAAVLVAVMAWAFNPVAVYAVQYLTQRSTLMATAFVLLMLQWALVALRAGTTGKRIAAWGGAGIAYLLALASKEHAAPAIALLLPLYVLWCRPPGRIVWRVALAALSSVAVVALLLIRFKGWQVGAATEDMVRPLLQQLEALQPGASERVYLLSVLNQGWLFFRYGLLWLLPWPGWMSVDLRPPFPLTWHAMPQLLGGILFVTVAVAAAWMLLARRGRWALLGWIVLAPAILFSTELAFVRLQEPFVLYRSYLWSITLPALGSVILLGLVRAIPVVIGIGVVMAATLGLLAHDRIQSLRDDPTAWRDALQKIDRDAAANVLGRWRPPHNLARWALTEHRFAEALDHARLADELGAPDGLAKAKMGAALVALRKPREALPVLQQAVAEGYDGAEIWVSIGSALDQLGRADEAFDAYDRALNGDLHERYRPATLLAAGHMANRVRRHDKAVAYFTELRALQPQSAVAAIGLALALAGMGDSRQALAVLSDAIAHRPGADLLAARAQLHWQLGEREAARRDAAEAVAREPRNPVYQELQRRLDTQPDPSGSAMSATR